MADKYYTSEKIHELILKYNANIMKIINDKSSIDICEDYSKLPNDLTEDTIAYCKNDYTDNTDINNTVVYNSGLYVYIFSETKWNYIGKEQFEIEEVTEDDIDAWF